MWRWADQFDASHDPIAPNVAFRFVQPAAGRQACAYLKAVLAGAERHNRRPLAEGGGIVRDGVLDRERDPAC